MKLEKKMRPSLSKQFAAIVEVPDSIGKRSSKHHFGCPCCSKTVEKQSSRKEARKIIKMEQKINAVVLNVSEHSKVITSHLFRVLSQHIKPKSRRFSFKDTLYPWPAEMLFQDWAITRYKVGKDLPLQPLSATTISVIQQLDPQLSWLSTRYDLPRGLHAHITTLKVSYLLEKNSVRLVGTYTFFNQNGVNQALTSKVSNTDVDPCF